MHTTEPPADPSYPRARRTATVETLHGLRVADPYRWLEDAGSRETRDWQEAQDLLYAAHRASWAGGFGTRLRTLYGAGTEQVPRWAGQRRFFLRRPAHQEHDVLYTAAPGDPERTLLDPAALDPTGGLTLDSWEPSRDGALTACQLSTGGTENARLAVLDTSTGRPIEGSIGGCRYSPLAWLPCGTAFYYVRRPAAGADAARQRWLWLHRLGTSPAEDYLVFGSPDDPRRVYDVRTSADGRWLLLSLAEGPARPNEVLLAALGPPGSARPAFRTIQPLGRARTHAEVGPDGLLYLLTDLNAPGGRLCVTDPDQPAAPWRELLAEEPGIVLRGFALSTPADQGAGQGRLLAVRARDAVSEISVHDARTGVRRGEVPLPGAGTVTQLSVRPGGGDEFWIGYTDLCTPPTVLRYDARRGAIGAGAGALRAATGRTVTHQVSYRSKDGTEIRMLLLAPAGAGPGADGGRPVLLTAYGGFGVSSAPTYQPDALAWAEAGGVYAVAQVRGGGERGAAWHQAGRGAHKQNSFDDFHAAADWLVAQGWAAPGRIGAVGSSNGGLLAGAALTQRPELFEAVVCSAPLLDMARYERRGMGPLWRAEYGTVDEPEQAGWLLGYSPYHHVRVGATYPAALFAVFEGDTRVDPAHARKMCAALQHATTGGPVLLRREAGAGHGQRSVSRTAAYSADVLAFLAARLRLGS